MPVSNGIFSKPIRLKEDLANFFGLSANLGNIVVNGSINMWAKYKPVNWDGKIDIHTTNSEWYKGIDGLCGYTMTYGSASTLPTMIKNVLANGSDWGYASDKKAYRLLDFDGYNHNCVKPFVSRIIDYIYSTSVSVSDAIIYSNQYESGYDIDGNFILTDLSIDGSSCANWYSGIIIADDSGNFVAGITSNNTISIDKQTSIKASYVNLSPSLIESGTYNIIPIISSVKKQGVDALYASKGDSWTDGTIAFLPMGFGKLYITDYVDAKIWYKVYTTSTSVVIQLYGTNNLDLPITIDKVNTYIEYYDRVAEEAGRPNEWVTILEDLEQDVNETIPANTTNFEFRNASGAIPKSLMNPPSWGETFRVRVEPTYSHEVAGGSTEFLDDGDIYG